MTPRPRYRTSERDRVTLTAMTSPNLDTSAEQEAGDTASLKNRRRIGTKKRSVLAPVTPPGEEELPPLPDKHKNMASALSRRSMTLGHPADKKQPAVAESGGYVPESALKNYIVSKFDASEQILPSGCRTPITRTLWSRGQHVRRDVYATYLDLHPELAAPPTIEVDLPADEDQNDQEDEDTEGSGEAPTDTDQTV